MTPSFGALDLSQSNAVTGILKQNVGGTGVSGNATFPISGVVTTDVMVQTLSNKTLSKPIITTGTINGSSFIGDSTVIDTLGTIRAADTTIAGNITIKGDTNSAHKLVFNDKGSTFSLAFKAPDTLSASTVWTLPSADGGIGQVLGTNGSRDLTWISAIPPNGVAGGDLSGSYPNPMLATSGVIAGVYPKVSVDSKGRVINATFS